MANLSNLTTTSELVQYRTDNTVDPNEQNDNEGTIRSKLNTVISAINDGSVVETATDQTITGTKTITGTFKIDQIDPTSTDGNILINTGGEIYKDSAVAGNQLTTLTTVQSEISSLVSADIDLIYGDVQTSAFNAVVGYVYLVNTTSSAFTGTLSASPSDGDVIGFVDIGGNCVTNNFTVGRNGKSIQGSANDLDCNVNYGTMYLIYDSSAGSWYLL